MTDIIEKLKSRVAERRLIERDLPAFPTRSQFLTDKEQMVLSSIQSRSMRLWWASLTAKQRSEMARRISEGHARNKTRRR